MVSRLYSIAQKMLQENIIKRSWPGKLIAQTCGYQDSEAHSTHRLRLWMSPSIVVIVVCVSLLRFSLVEQILGNRLARNEVCAALDFISFIIIIPIHPYRGIASGCYIESLNIYIEYISGGITNQEHLLLLTLYSIHCRRQEQDTRLQCLQVVPFKYCGSSSEIG